jgi:putative inorganic carbon (hco3(-)) transporter
LAFVGFGSLANLVGLGASLLRLGAGVVTPLMDGVRTNGLLLNANAHGFFVVMVFLFQLLLLLERWRKVGNDTLLRIYAVNALLLALGVLLAFSRSSWLACAAGVLVIIACTRLRSLPAILALFGLGVAGVYVLSTFSDVGSSMLPTAQALHSIEARASINEVALRLVAERPETMLFGIGIGTFLVRSPEFFPEWTVQIHNSYVWFLAEMGLIGFGMFAGLMLTALYRSWRAVRAFGEREPLLIAVLAAVVAILVYMVGYEGLYQRILWMLFALAETSRVLVTADRRTAVDPGLAVSPAGRVAAQPADA